MVFIISYDLRKPDFDYDGLYEQLEALEAKHIQDSVWAVRSNYSAGQLWNVLWKHMHSERDRLFVVPFDKTNQFHSKNAINKLSSV